MVVVDVSGIVQLLHNWQCLCCVKFFNAWQYSHEIIKHHTYIHTHIHISYKEILLANEIVKDHTQIIEEDNNNSFRNRTSHVIE